MSASPRAPKPRYIFPDRERIAMFAGASCGFVVLVVSMFVQRHALLETVFRAMVAMLITYVAVYVVMWVVAYLRDTQSVVEETGLETEAEEPKTE